MITCELIGGLGNQLFQIFTTIYYAIQLDHEYKFTDSKSSLSITPRNTYWNSLLSNLKGVTTNIFPEDIVKIKEIDFTYHDIMESPEFKEIVEKNVIKETNIMLCGYFQSYKYFEKNFEQICKLIDIQKKKQSVLQSSDYTENYLKNTISLHFRMGDYKKLHWIHPIMPYEYYEKALLCIKSKSVNNLNQVLYFCEDEDIEDVNQIIGKLQIKFPNDVFTRCSNLLEDWEQLILMSLCKHNIIGNSSFSWWAAYLNTNDNKIVSRPRMWFGESIGHDITDLCPPEWNTIEF